MKMMAIDEIELGAAGLNFDAISELRRKDAKAQEALVDIIACCLEQACLMNDAKQVGNRLVLAVQNDCSCSGCHGWCLEFTGTLPQICLREEACRLEVTVKCNLGYPFRRLLSMFDV
jgi:hypothetical protein